MLAQEARAAVRAAEAASVAAIQAQAAAESMLANLEANLKAGLEAESASSGRQAWEPEIREAADSNPEWTPAAEPVHPVGTAAAGGGVAAGAPHSNRPAKRQAFEIRWDADLPTRESQPAVARASRGLSLLGAPAEGLREQRREVREALDTQGLEVVEAAKPIHANLIHYPRELVATRKVRPRRAEGPYAAAVAAQGQLSIFEVEQCTISTEPQAAGAAEGNSHTWVGPEWSGIELDPEPRQEMASPAVAPAEQQSAKPAATRLTLTPAPINQRILSAIIDSSLATAAFLAVGLVSTMNAQALPSTREIELGSVMALLLTGALYQAFFFTLFGATPGMKYARLKLSNFAGREPALAQRLIRAAAVPLSLLPLGVGIMSTIFDEQHLTWHDRMSGTYLRKG
jgi:uncharacterized RDD family membrane protein YckC